jgi:hypothetical protein
MPNTALALLDTVTEPAIAMEGRDRCEWLVSAVPPEARPPGCVFRSIVITDSGGR